ncbi:mannose-binding protein [Streptomyces griseoluteus]|uniref:mannose-binding protein n=1 Tax=Streptomyces griseoluteus TaxID=29306 RepID=UPI0036C0310E
MSPQHPAPGAIAETAATRPGEAGPPPSPSAPEVNTPAPGARSTATAPAAKSAATPAGKAATAPAGESTTAPTERNTATPTAAPATPPTEGGDTSVPPPTAPAAASATAKARPDAVAVAAAAVTPPVVRTETEVDRGRPHTAMLAGAALLGAALVAIPVLLTGSGNDDGPRRPVGLAAGDSDTVLSPQSAPAALDDYVTEKPSPSPAKEKPKRAAVPKPVAAQPVAPAPKPSPSHTAEKKKPRPRPEPKPKAAPKPHWSTETVQATSVLEVNQAWTTNRIRLVMQTDGNLVVYNENGHALWAAMTFGQNHRAVFQSDGNLVVYNADNRPIWASQTNGHDGAQLVLRTDAKVAIVSNGQTIWTT